MGANIEADDLRGNTALMEAIAGGHTEIIKLLLLSGANINRKSSNKAGPLDVAYVSCRHDLVDLLLRKGAKGISSGTLQYYNDECAPNSRAKQ